MLNDLYIDLALGPGEAYPVTACMCKLKISCINAVLDLPLTGLAVYDYFLTLHDEVQLLRKGGKRPGPMVLVLYLGIRYFTIIRLVFYMLITVRANNTQGVGLSAQS